MNVTTPGSITISGVAVLQSPRAVDPQKGPRNVVFDANFCIVEGSQTVTMGLLRYFASNDAANDIQMMGEKPFQKAFVVANVRIYILFHNSFTTSFLQISSITPTSISSFMSDFEPSDYAFVGDIYQVRHTSFTLKQPPHPVFTKLIPFDGDVNMQVNPFITITGNVSKFNASDRSFTMTPTQYIALTHSTSPLPIHAHFADSESKKRWGPDGPKVAVGSTITLGGSFQRVAREHNIDRSLEFVQVEVSNIAYLGTRGNLASSSMREFFLSLNHRYNYIIIVVPQLQTRKVLDHANDGTGTIFTDHHKLPFHQRVLHPLRRKEKNVMNPTMKIRLS
jgi:hypothetical protein